MTEFIHSATFMYIRFAILGVGVVLAFTMSKEKPSLRITAGAAIGLFVVLSVLPYLM